MKANQNKATSMLMIEFLELVFTNTTSEELRTFVSMIVFEKLQLLINFFVDFDLDSKGVTNFAYFMEEEFKDKFEGLVDQELDGTAERSSGSCVGTVG